MSAETNQRKKPYEKPMMHIIELAAGEVLGTGCKVGGTTCTTTPTYDAGS